VRLKSTTFTGGLGNFVVATLELAGSLAASIIAILAPVIAIFVVTGVLLVSLMILRQRRRRIGARVPVAN
jgi:hypothetical protein